MAPMCLVRFSARCYLADSEVDPPLKDRRPVWIWEVIYEGDASLLCGNWLCGGTLDFQAAASSRSSDTVPISGTFVEQVLLGRASRCAYHFVSARPKFSFFPRLSKVPSSFPLFRRLSIQFA
jgi:hypothetical protein